MALAAVPFVAEAVFIVRADRRLLYTSMPDDAFYYLEIAQRAARGEGFTFDGMNSTSGYHPLWQWLLTALHHFAPGEIEFVQATRLVGLALVAIAFALVTRVVWRALGPWPALAGLLLASHSVGVLRDFSGGMETPVVLLALALLLTTLTRFLERPRPRSAVLVGLTCGFLVLARLDMAVVVPVIGVAVLWKTRSWRLAASWAGGGLIVGLPYAAYHLAAHGEVATTSARVKGYWVEDLLVREHGGRFTADHVLSIAQSLARYLQRIFEQVVSWGGGPLRTLAAAVLLLLCAVAVASRLQDRQTNRLPLSPFAGSAITVAAAIALKALVDLVVVPLWALSWYSAPATSLMAFSLGATSVTGLLVLMRKHRWSGLLAVVLLPLFLPAGVGDAVEGIGATYVWQVELDKAVDELGEPDPDKLYGAFDAGLIGYRLDGRAHLVNLDGLVNDSEYADFLEHRPTRPEMVEREEIDVFVNALEVEVREADYACAATMWQNDRSIPITGRGTPDRVYILDMSAC